MIRLSLRRSTVFGAWLWAASFAATAFAQAPPKPNVIILLADDAGYADFGFMNQFTGQTTEVKTPNLNALALQSQVFSNGYTAAAVCSVSRAGLLTGRAPQSFGFEYNAATTGTATDGVPTNELLMTEAMKQAGYKTGVFGKWHIGSSVDRQPQNQGVDEFYGIHAGGRPYFATGGVQVLRNTTAIQWQNEASFNNIPPDPVLGRSFTDALGDEASKFVATSANQANPFFMYVPFTAPHSPYDQAKQQDLAAYDSTSLTSFRKNGAANMLAMDRAVGNILARVNDPNGDGNTSDSVANNTMIVFYNDNGGEQPYSASNFEVVHNNGPLYNYKGTQWEGGIRVPALIKMPGVAAGVYNQPVTALDFMPTILAAAGAPIPSNLDGKDLAPYLTGAQTGAVHDALFFRQGFAGWAMRQGDWKLVHGSETAGYQLRKLNADGSGEAPSAPSYNSSEPMIYRSMLNQFVDWETTLEKARWTDSYPLNRFDGFRLRSDLATSTNWRDASVWVNDAAPGTIATMRREDPYANAALVFQPRNDASYTSNNNISRASGLYYGHIDGGSVNPAGLAEFMLNELRFDGQFSGAANRSGTLTGFPLMFTKSLSGSGAKIRLNNTANVASKFSFNVNMDVVLHDPLEITGNSNQEYAINGQIRDFDEAMSLTKTGTSAITLSGNNIYRGATIISGGTLRVEGANATLLNTSTVQIGAQGTLTLASGRVRTPVLDIANGGTFNFIGGALETPQVNGNVLNTGGSFRPGLSLALASITGDYTQTSGGTYTVEVGGLNVGTQYDRTVAGDDVSLAGALQVLLVNAFTPAVGTSFEILRATDSLTGTFNSFSLPSLPVGRRWGIQYTAQAAMLKVVAGLVADFDNNNMVNAADLVVWRNSFGANAAGDADLDGDTDGDDFLVWQRQLGSHFPALGVAASVPEPAGAALLAISLAGLYRSRAPRSSRQTSVA